MGFCVGVILPHLLQNLVFGGLMIGGLNQENQQSRFLFCQGNDLFRFDIGQGARNGIKIEEAIVIRQRLCLLFLQ